MNKKAIVIAITFLLEYITEYISSWSVSMRVVYKIDILFRGFYALLIVLLGVALAVVKERSMFIPVFLGLAIVFLAVSFRKNLKRYLAVRQTFPEAWRSVLLECSAFYRYIDTKARKRFERDIQIFLSDFNVKGIRGQQLEDRLRLLVAAGIATLIHGRPDWEPPVRDGIVVYPGQRFDRDYQSGKGWMAGQASYNGPLIVTKGSLEHSFRNPHDGYNVIFHELAHYFDLEDGSADGVPAFLPSEGIFAWKEIIYNEWEKVNRGQSFLDAYAGVNEAEFFAVSTEFFFEKPWVMAQRNPDLYNALKEFYNLDPIDIYGGKII